MVNRDHAHPGFGVAGATLLLVVLAAGGFAGWYSWQSHRNAEMPATTIATQTVTTETTLPSGTSTESSLDIKEWGVRIIAAARMPEMTYRLDTSGGIDWAMLQFAGLPEACRGYYHFSRSQPGNEIDGYGHSPEKLLEIDPTSVKKAGNYYYYFGHSQLNCDINNATKAKEEGYIAGITGGNNGYSIQEIPVSTQ